MAPIALATNRVFKEIDFSATGAHSTGGKPHPTLPQIQGQAIGHPGSLSVWFRRAAWYWELAGGPGDVAMVGVRRQAKPAPTRETFKLMMNDISGQGWLQNLLQGTIGTY